MSQTNRVDCPVCGRSFPTSSVNEHVNKCLNTNGPSNSSTGDDAATRILYDSTSPTATASLLDKSTGIFGKRPGTKANTVFMTSPPSSALKRSFSNNSSNLAGKSKGNNPFKRRKSNEATNGFKSLEHKGTAINNGVSSATKESGSCQSLNSPVSGKNKAQKSKNSQFMPLAERMRPKTFAEYVGQSKVLGSNSLLRTLLEAEEIPSMILWGPPGCGKTTLAHIVANSARCSNKARFVQLSATTSGINDVKEVVKVAKNEQQMFKRKTILFVDEIHRFNKLQQDTFLPHVESGTITLIGATTENPSFQLNNALLSRCRVIVLEKLTAEHVEQILKNALKSMGVLTRKEESMEMKVEQLTSEYSDYHVVVEDDAVKALANLCDGDARIALNGLQLAVQSQVAATKQQRKSNDSVPNSVSSPQQSGECSQNGKLPPNLNIDTEGFNEKKTVCVNVSHIKEGLQRTHLLYDRNGEEHYNIISAMHKSIRGSDENAALYWLARMLVGGEDPLYVARRLVRCASEDIGLADPQALNQAVAAYQACHFIGMPECDVILAQAAVYLARAPKSIEVYNAYSEAKKYVSGWEGPQPTVPLHIRNAPTKLMKGLGYGAGYKYNPAFDGPVDQTYLPPEVQGVDFFSWNKTKKN